MSGRITGVIWRSFLFIKAIFLGVKLLAVLLRQILKVAIQTSSIFAQFKYSPDFRYKPSNSYNSVKQIYSNSDYGLQFTFKVMN